jgi:hypothetical protein
MSLRIDADRERFSKIVRGKIQSNLKKLVSSGDMIGQVCGKIVKIPIHSIDLPRFAFGSRDQGGNGMGDGDEGDPMPGQGKKKGKGKGEASDGTEEHSFDMEFSAEEMADIMISELELPKLENKGKGKINSGSKSWSR